jgi:hypothetical protein
MLFFLYHVFTKSLQLFERRSTVSRNGGPSTICCNWSNTDVHSRNGKYPVEISYYKYRCFLANRISLEKKKLFTMVIPSDQTSDRTS